MTYSPMPPNLRRSPEIWETIRGDYVAGASTPVLGERNGLTARTISRRAALELIHSRTNVDARPHSPADYLRASMIRQINRDGTEGPDDFDEESDMSAMSPEIHSGPDPDG